MLLHLMAQRNTLQIRGEAGLHYCQLFLSQQFGVVGQQLGVNQSVAVSSLSLFVPTPAFGGVSVAEPSSSGRKQWQGEKVEH